MDIIKSVLVWLTGVLYMLVLFPVTFALWVLTLPFDRERTVTHMMLVFQSWLICHIMPVWKLETRMAAGNLRGRTFVMISNHQSILDILFINSLLLRFKWVSKIENMKVPVLGWYLRMAGYLVVDRSDRGSKDRMMEEALSCLRRGTSVMLFPEGTRSADGEIGFFRRGAFQLAIAAGVPVLPVVIDGTGGILPKHGMVFRNGHRVKVRVLEPIEPAEFVTDNYDELALWFSEFMKMELERLRSIN